MHHTQYNTQASDAADSIELCRINHFLVLNTAEWLEKLFAWCNTQYCYWSKQQLEMNEKSKALCTMFCHICYQEGRRVGVGEEGL